METIWKPILNYEGFYEISNKGDIKSVDRIVLSKTNRFCKGKILKQNIDKYGYKTIQLYKNGQRKALFVHRLVLSSFIGFIENKIQVNHINGVKNDNKLNNLEWVTAKENTIHAWKIGLAKK